MTEQQHKKAIYAKVQKKYPAVTDTQEMTRLAIAADRQRTTWICIALLWASIVCAGLFCFDFVTGVMAGCCIVFFLTAGFEYFRTILDAKKISVHYISQLRPAFKGTLTHQQLRKDCKSTANGDYTILKATLTDKDDNDNSGVSFIFHKYTLFFQMPNSVSVSSLRVKRSAYLEAPLDGEYILVMSPTQEILAAYIADAWEISADLFPKCTFPADQHNSGLSRDTRPTTMPVATNSVIWDIVFLVAHVLAMFLPAFLPLIYLPFTTFFATKSAVKQQTAFSILAVVSGFISLVAAALFICL